MSIRLRTMPDGLLVALCAARSIEKPGDVYLDDGAHSALAAKFEMDFAGEGISLSPQVQPYAEAIEREESSNPAREEWERVFGHPGSGELLSTSAPTAVEASDIGPLQPLDGGVALSSERWLPVAGYEGLYEVSDAGNVRRLGGTPKCKRTRPLVRVIMRKRGGYICASLWKNNAPLLARVHRLVAEAFVGLIPDGWVVNHLDGNKQNNVPANLEITTYAGNARHAAETGLTKRGQEAGQTVLTEEQVKWALSVYRRGSFGYRQVGDALGVRSEYIRDIITGRTWCHLTGRRRSAKAPSQRTKTEKYPARQLYLDRKVGAVA